MSNQTSPANTARYHVLKTTTDKLEETLNADVSAHLRHLRHVGGRDWVAVFDDGEPINAGEPGPLIAAMTDLLVHYRHPGAKRTSCELWVRDGATTLEVTTDPNAATCPVCQQHLLAAPAREIAHLIDGPGNRTACGLPRGTQEVKVTTRDRRYVTCQACLDKATLSGTDPDAVWATAGQPTETVHYRLDESTTPAAYCGVADLGAVISSYRALVTCSYCLADLDAREHQTTTATPRPKGGWVHRSVPGERHTLCGQPAQRHQLKTDTSSEVTCPECRDLIDSGVSGRVGVDDGTFPEGELDEGYPSRQLIVRATDVYKAAYDQLAGREHDWTLETPVREQAIRAVLVLADIHRRPRTDDDETAAAVIRDNTSELRRLEAWLDFHQTLWQGWNGSVVDIVLTLLDKFVAADRERKVQQDEVNVATIGPIRDDLRVVLNGGAGDQAALDAAIQRLRAVL